MPQNSELISRRFLSELYSSKTESLFETLNLLLETLEDKEDPTPTELRIVDLSYQIIEKIQILETLLKKYSQFKGRTDGEKLQNLYEKMPTKTGTSILFD